MNNFLWINIEDGFSQQERLITGLMPDSVKLDGRSRDDLINFMAAFSRELNYYNLKNEKYGDWFDFFVTDFSTLIILLSTFDIKGYENWFDNALRDLSGILSTFDVTRYNDWFDGKQRSLDGIDKLDLQLYAFDKFCVQIFQFSSILTEVDKRTRYVNKSNVESVLTEGLTNSVAKIIDIQKELKGYILLAGSAFGSQYFNGINTIFNAVGITEGKKGLRNIFGGGKKTDSKKLDSFLPLLRKMLQDIFNTYNNLLGLAGFYIKSEKEKIPDGNENPHISLIYSFLHLYSHLQTQMNGITKKHLDYYYKTLLGIEPTPAVPDQAHVFFNTLPSVNSVLIKEGEILIAEYGDNKKLLNYATKQDLIVTNTQIEKLYTLFISNYVQMEGGYTNDDIREAQVYKAVHTVINGGDLPSTGAVKPWPVMGEDQHDMAENSTTMQYADIGFILGSPVFFQPEGTRQFAIKLHFTTASFGGLVNYVKNFAAVTAKHVGSALHELLHTAFVIHYTATSGWAPVANYAVTCDIDDAENRAIDITFKLSSKDKPFGVYTMEIHAGHFDEGRSLVRFLVNNEAPHNAFTFLRDLIIERITATVQVKDFSLLQMKNDLGYLNPVLPFQPFGPQPVVTSALQIKNSNVLNRFTKAFNINIDWVNLPAIPHGFNDYYEAYNVNITNSSFKVSIGTGEKKDRDNIAKDEQVLELFDVYRDDDGVIHLSNSTLLANIKVNQLNFENEMLLDKENILLFNGQNTGAVRLALTSPPVAFGHSVYTAKLPDVLMHNAKKGVAKMAVPQPPYTPLVKSVTIDYTLAHNEIINSFGNANKTESSFIFYNIHPFGYEKAFPSQKEMPVYLMPQINQCSNLIIGLKNLDAGQELALLFELGKSKFDDTAYEPEEVAWAYLANNTWLAFDKKNILSDSTGNLTKSGIVRLQAPPNAPYGNTIFSPALFWLRASTPQTSKLKSCISGVFTNAVLVERILAPNAADDKKQLVLQPGAIKKLANRIPGIQNIWQPFVSFGGREEETVKNYYIRVSERLRHRNRPQTALDIGQLVLEAFPDILSVKCITKNMASAAIVHQPDITLILIPKQYGPAGAGGDNELPKVTLATLYKVELFVRKKFPPSIRIKVCNPVYEKIKTVCKIQFKQGKQADGRQLLKMLDTDIQKYICPWLFDANEEIKIGSSIYTQEFLNYIKTLDYVDFVTGFSVLHFYSIEYAQGKYRSAINDTAVTNASVIKASGPGRILIPSEKHIITVIDKNMAKPAVRQGIGSLMIGEELLIREHSQKIESNDVATENTSVVEKGEENFIFTIYT